MEDATIATITVPGEPFGKPRPRHGGHGTYRTKRDVQYELRVREAWRAAGSPSFGAAPVSVTVDAWDVLPKSAPRRMASRPYALKPDADNIAKAVTDPLNGCAWEDDKQIVRLTVTKHDQRRDTVPRVVVTVTDEIGDEC